MPKPKNQEPEESPQEPEIGGLTQHDLMRLVFWRAEENEEQVQGAEEPPRDEPGGQADTSSR